MKRFLTIVLVFATAAAGAQTIRQSQIEHVQTSLNHLTVLEFGEPVTTLAIGDRDSFQIERRGDKVFVMPLKEGAATNLFVWTASRELTYELDPAGKVAAMDVLVRSLPALSQHRAVLAATEPSDTEIRKIALLVLTQAMIGAEDIAREPQKRHADRVQITLEQVYRAKDRVYIRYSLINQTKAPFRLTTPDVSVPVLTRVPVSLLGLKDHQITAQVFGEFKAKKGPELPVVEAESVKRDLAPGERTTGVISIVCQADDAPRIYQLNFGADQTGVLRVEAVL